MHIIHRVLNAASFDAVYVQFYNNYCSLPNFNNSNDWNFADWDNWAKNTSPNKNVKIYIGAPASSTAAGSGYVDVTTLGSIAVATRNQYSSFGGVMLWDASQAYGACLPLHVHGYLKLTHYFPRYSERSLRPGDQERDPPER